MTTTFPDALCDSRVEVISRSLARHRLIFVQMGTAFEPIRSEVLGRLGILPLGVADIGKWASQVEDSQAVLIRDVECCVDSSPVTLGAVRERVHEMMDAGISVCLVSRSPRVWYGTIPGSSILEDSALVHLPLLKRREIVLSEGESLAKNWKWPASAFGPDPIEVVYQNALGELGQGLIAALDHALFEVDPKGPAGLRFLAPREIEGLRGSGFVEVGSDGVPVVAAPGLLKTLREAVAAQISRMASPADSLASVTAGLWFIERQLRHAVREAAISKWGSTWRAAVLGGLAKEVLKRAQLDSVVTAKAVTDLRDPLEWLTLSELLDIMPKFDELKVDSVIWRRFREDVVPVRNRLAHVRILKSNDEEVVTMWASLLRARFKS